MNFLKLLSAIAIEVMIIIVAGAVAILMAAIAVGAWAAIIEEVWR